MRTAIDIGSMKAARRASDARDREHLRGRHGEALLQGAVEVDADQLNPLAGVAAAEQAGLAAAAGEHGPHGHALAGGEAGRAAGADVLDDRRELVALDAGIELVDSGTEPRFAWK